MHFIDLEVDRSIRSEVVTGREQITDKRRFRRFTFCEVVVGKRNAGRLYDFP